VTQRILGSQEVIEQPKRKRMVRGKGWQTVRSWQGTRAAIEAFKTSADLDDSEDVQISTSRGVSTLEATFPYDADNEASRDPGEMEEVWEVDFQELQKPIGTHTFLNDLGSTRAAKLAEADAAIADGTAAALLAAGTTAASIKKYLRLRLTGIDTYVVFSPVVQRTIKCGRRVDVKAASAGVGSVVKTSSLPAPKDMLYVVPSSWEWLKQGPKVQQVPGGWQIIESWVGAEKWMADLYSGGTGQPSS